jgi:hypothetical protein
MVRFKRAPVSRPGGEVGARRQCAGRPNSLLLRPDSLSDGSDAPKTDRGLDLRASAREARWQRRLSGLVAAGELERGSCACRPGTEEAAPCNIWPACGKLAAACGRYPVSERNGTFDPGRGPLVHRHRHQQTPDLLNYSVTIGSPGAAASTSAHAGRRLCHVSATTNVALALGGLRAATIRTIQIAALATHARYAGCSR